MPSLFARLFIGVPGVSVSQAKRHLFPVHLKAFLATAACSLASLALLAPLSSVHAEPAVSLALVTQQIADGLERQGELHMHTKVTEHQMEHSNGAASWDVTTGTCKLSIRREALAAVGESASSPLWGRFLAYHELSHCDLFHDPRGLSAGLTGLTQPARDMVDDFFALQAIEIAPGVSEEPRANNFMIFHEAYADSLALLRLRQEGHSSDELAFVMKFRLAGGYTVAHETTDAVASILKMSDEIVMHLSTAQTHETAKLIALRHVMRRMTTSVLGGDGSFIILGPRIAASVQSIYDSVQVEPLHFAPFFEGADVAPLEQLQGYPCLQRLRQSVEMARSVSSEAFLTDWISQRYGLDQDGFRATALELSKRLEVDAMAWSAPDDAAQGSAAPLNHVSAVKRKKARGG